MSEIVLPMAVGMLGATLGLLLGRFWQKLEAPSIKTLRLALEDSEQYYKSQIGRYKGRLKEYEQPSELQQMASNLQGAPEGDVISAFVSQIGGMRGVPRWIRPFLPAIVGYVKENPQQVMALFKQAQSAFSKAGGTKELSSQSEDSL